MILGIDAHKIDTIHPTGTDKVTSYFIKNISSAISKQFDNIILYTKKPIPSDIVTNLPDNIHNKIINLPYFWSSVGLSWQMKFHSPDILFVPSHSLPMITPKKTAIIIHDIGFLEYPQNYDSKQLIHLQQTTQKDIRTADIIFTPSEFVKKTLINKYFADPNKIFSVHLGIDKDRFITKHNRAECISILGKYNDLLNTKPYFFFVGRLDYRKNIINLISAFNQFKDSLSSNHLLVLSGQPGIGYDEVLKTVSQSKYASDIIFTDYINEQDLPTIMSEADIFLFPSLYEGFGLPILEAQASGTPVITSSVTAMPEIAGKGALLVDPKNSTEMFKAMRKIIENHSLRINLIEFGSKNIINYSWENFTSTIFKQLTLLAKKL
ncbi:MAG TPA: glycosyltransferase family 1 protein [bacterium]|nr:glycosyltransferase family 1 protein [bacterium]